MTTFNKHPIKKYQDAQGRTIHITEILSFHEVGYYQDGQVWERCVIALEYLKENPEEFQLIP